MKKYIKKGEIIRAIIEPKETYFEDKAYKLSTLSFRKSIIRRVSKLYLVDHRVPIVDDILTQICHLPLFLFNTLASYSQYIMEYYVPFILLL